MGFFDFIKNLFSNGKKNPKFIVEDLNKVVKASEPLEVGLYDNKEPLVNKEVTIEINNAYYDRKTDENGIAKLNINLGVGHYRAHVEFEGDEQYNSTNAYVNVDVNPIIQTADLNMEYKDGNKFIATLKDNDNNNLPNIKVFFKINGVLYERQTDENGQARLNINLDKGQHKIETFCNKASINNTINITEKTIIPTTVKTETKHFGYWVFGKDMYNVDTAFLQQQGVTDIFLNYYSIKTYGQDKVQEWIKKTPMKVHIWMQCFYDGEWHNPANTDLSAKINEAKQYASIANVAGVHLDYLRYPGTAYKTNGGADAITSFVRKVREVIPKNITLSCAVMPENEAKYYYGQDIEALGKILDVIIPMQYKGNYNAGTSWLASTTKTLSNKATIWSGLQTYKSDNDTSLLSDNELVKDIQTCLDNGAKGAILFRYGLSNYINFNTLISAQNTEKESTRMEGTDINMFYKDGTKYQCAIYDSHDRVRDKVTLTINGVPYERTADNEGLYKLNLNLNPGTYTIKAEFKGNDKYLPSSVTNTIVIKEKPQEAPKTVVQLNSYLNSTGCSGMGQCNGYFCACNSLQQCFYRLTGKLVSESTIASVAGTTTAGTDHEGINTAVSWFNRKYGTNIKITWKNFSDLGNSQAERYAKMQEYINNGALFVHLLYRDQYGHYEVPKSINSSNGTITVFNSLGSYCSYPAYCGYLETRSYGTQQSYINGISQKSIAILTI